MTKRGDASRPTAVSERDLHLLGVFACVAKERSFTRAASRLGVSKSVVSESIQRLEGACGARLVDRTTRSLRLTDAGADVLPIALAVTEVPAALRAVLEARKNEPAGTLRVATTHALVADFVAPACAALVRAHPRLGVEIVADDATHDLVAERFDVAVRIGPPADSSYVMKKLGTCSEIIVASDSVAGRAAVSRPHDLPDHPWVAHTLVAPGRRFRFRGPHGQTSEIEPRIRARANTVDGFRSLLLRGAGYGVIPDLFVQTDLHRGALVEPCPGWIRRTVPIHALTASNRPPRAAAHLIQALQQAIERAQVGAA